MRDLRIVVSRQFVYSKTSKDTFFVEEHLHKLANLGVTVGFVISPSINGFDEILGCESLRISRVRLIEDEPLRFRHIAREVVPKNICRLILI